MELMNPINTCVECLMASDNQFIENNMNLAALKGVDVCISCILDTATQVALYSYNSQKNEWERTEVEGSFFVYKRVVHPYWGFIIMNRLNTTNQIEPITKELDYQIKTPFFLYKNAQLKIYGIWFYESSECERIGNLIGRLANASSCVSSIDSRKSIDKDILSLLTKGQIENHALLQKSHISEDSNNDNVTIKELFSKNSTKPLQAEILEEDLKREAIPHSFKFVKKENLKKGNASSELSKYPPLLSPMVFTLPKTQQLSNVGTKILQQPVNDDNSLQVNGCTNDMLCSPLTRAQILQAINYLLKNDPEFIVKIHEAYVQSMNEITLKGKS